MPWSFKNPLDLSGRGPHKREIKRLHQDCRERLSEFDLPDDCAIRTFCAHVGRKLGRRIHLISFPLQTSDPSGIWLALADADFIVYEANTSKPHQDHIIAHELGHLLHGHLGDTLDRDTTELLFPDLDPDVLRRSLKRHTYTELEERQAEVMAQVISEQLADNRRSKAEQSRRNMSNVIGRIHRSLGSDPDLR